MYEKNGIEGRKNMFIIINICAGGNERGREEIR